MKVSEFDDDMRAGLSGRFRLNCQTTLFMVGRVVTGE